MSLQSQFARAREVAAYADDSKVDQLTRMLMEQGCLILQSHKLGPSDADHVLKLLEKFNPPQGAHVLDVGSGVGAVAWAMRAWRPDLHFTLLNISPAQLAMSLSPDMTKLHGDMHDIPAPDESFDAVMFTFSLGHGLLDTCMGEAARVLQPGGVLFIYDIATKDQDHLIERMGYRPHTPEEVLEAAEHHRFLPTLVERPEATTDDFVAIFGSLEEHGIERTWPMLYRFVK